MGLIDSHAHLTHPDLGDQVESVLDRCAEVGVEHIVTVGTDLADAHQAIDLRSRFSARISATAGFHPHEAEKVTAGDMAQMTALWHDSGLVAIGEIGLDYHYDFADRSVQQRVLEQQLEASTELDLPLIIHCREAFDDTLELLEKYNYPQRPVVFHCFTGTASEAQRLARLGWRLSFTGIVTFRKSTWLQEIARAYPADLLMVETDSPYLSPEPVRSKRPNEPAHVHHTARFLAGLRDTSLEAFTNQTTANTRRFFGLPPSA